MPQSVTSAIGSSLLCFMTVAWCASPLVQDGLEDVREAFIIGDLHADPVCAEEWIRRSGLVDLETWTWIGGPNTALIFMGDYVDKGPHGRQVLEIVRNLTVLFPRQVVAMLGNHDLYFLADILIKEGATQLMGTPVRNFAYAFTHPEEYLNWIPADKQDHNDTAVILPALYAALEFVYSRNSESQVMLGSVSSQGAIDLFKQVPPFSNDASLARLVRRRLKEWQGFMAQGMVESGLASWLAARPVVAAVGGALLVHGGLPHKMVASLKASDVSKPTATALEEVTNAALERLFRDQELSPGALGDFSKLLSHEDVGGDLELIHEAVTYRGLHGGRHGGPSPCKEVEALLRLLGPDTGAELLVVGHTPGDEVRTSCNGRLAAVDSSLSRYFRAYGNRYCPVTVHVDSLAGSGCRAKVSTKCEGQAARLLRHKDAWRLVPVDLLASHPSNDRSGKDEGSKPESIASSPSILVMSLWLVVLAGLACLSCARRRKISGTLGKRD